MRICFVVCLLPLLLGFSRQQARAQQESDYSEERRAIEAGETYLDLRMEALDQYLDRSTRIYRRLQKKLERKEKKLLRKLARKDAAQLPEGYQPGLPEPDSTGSTRSRRHSGSAALVDSLRGVQQFIQQQAGRLSSVDKALPDETYTKQLNQLQQRLQVQEALQAALQKKTKALEGLAGKKLNGVKGLQKELYYATEQIQYWKELSNEPDKVEAQALEYLMGTEGFVQALPDRSRNAFGGLGNDATAADLQRLGFQTKQQVNGMLRDKFGDRLEDAQAQMGEQLSQYLDGVNKKINKVKSAGQTVRQTMTQARNMKHQLGDIEKPVFKNPMRGIPFIKRFKISYDFQSSRSADDQPAMLTPGASLAYRQTPIFRAGIGVFANIGVGEGWQNLKLSYEGLHLRAFADREILFGFGIQAGYERIFRPANRPYLPAEQPAEQSENIWNAAFGGQQEVAYIGLIKRYRINAKWQGTFMIGYNFLWQTYNMKSPLLIRFGWEK